MEDRTAQSRFLVTFIVVAWLSDDLRTRVRGGSKGWARLRILSEHAIINQPLHHGTW